MSLHSNHAQTAPSADGAAISAAVNWLSLAATPTFAMMALLTGATSGAGMICSHGASPLSGMVAMYILMSAFHSAPWLKLIYSRRSGARRS